MGEGTSALVAIFFFSSDRPTKLHTIEQPLHNAERATITLSCQACDLHVTDSNSTDNIVQRSITTGWNESLRTITDFNDNVVDLSLTNSSTLSFFHTSADSDWSLELARQIPIELYISANVGEIHLDLEELDVASLFVESDVTSVTIDLPSKTSLNGQIVGRVGRLVLNVPSEVGLSLDTETGIVKRNLPTGYVERNGTYFSPNYDIAERLIDLRIKSAVGTISVNHDPTD